MKYLTLIALILLALVNSISGQNIGDSALQARRDSIRVTDSLIAAQRVKDSIFKRVQEDIARAADSVKAATITRRKQIIANVQAVLKEHPTFSFSKPPVRQSIEVRKQESDDGIFYFIVGLVLYLALMRIIFFKYISTMFTLFFRATLRQQQLREQLLQAPLPALLMNIFFVLSVSTFITFVGRTHNVSLAGNFWSDLVYAVVLVAGVYLIKYIFLNAVGWIFGISNVADTYAFIVFLINKMIGIFLLPFIALLAFPTERLLPAVLMISYILIGGMLIYRFMISYRPLRSEIKLSRIHFFIYLCAFEIAPLLLIYKVLLEFADRSS